MENSGAKFIPGHYLWLEYSHFLGWQGAHEKQGHLPGYQSLFLQGKGWTWHHTILYGEALDRVFQAAALHCEYCSRVHWVLGL